MLLHRIIFLVSLFIFCIALTINFVLLVDPRLTSEPLEGMMSVMLLISVVSLFICASPVWSLTGKHKDSYWIKVFFEYCLPIYYVFVTALVIYYEFYSHKESHFFSKSLGLAALLLLFSGLAVRWSYHQTRNPKLQR